MSEIKIPDVLPPKDWPGPNMDEKYQKLCDRFMESDRNMSDEFIINEALRVYAGLNNCDKDLKIRILELLRLCHY